MKNSTILITGGTGSFGQVFVPLTLSKFNPKRIVVFSRDEIKQWEMSQKYINDSRVEFIIGDIRDKSRLLYALRDIDYVVHAAATKIVTTAEYNPFECVRTNINGAMNLIEACYSARIKKVVALSTDKASNPVNFYGATKLASDKLFVSANSSLANSVTKYSVVRYGNVMGSRGSVIPFFLSLKQKNTLPITDVRMTRFMITLESAVELVWKSLDDMEGGEIYIKKIPSMKLVDIASSIAPDAKFEIIGIRPGEKIHEQMIGIEDAPHTYSYDGYYKILPMLHKWHLDPKRVKHGKKVNENFIYNSENNKKWMTRTQLQNWIKKTYG